MNKTYEVKYMYKNDIDSICSERVDFETEEEARNFINKLMNSKEIIKIHYIYLTTTEKVI